VDGGSKRERERERGEGEGGGLKLHLHVETSICACLAEEEAGAGNNCHSLSREYGLRSVGGERVMDSGRLIINSVKLRE